MGIETRISNQKPTSSIISEVIKQVDSKTPVTPGTTTPQTKSTFPYEPVVPLGEGTSFIIDWSKGGAFKLKPSGDFSIVMTNMPPADMCGKIVLIVENAAGKAITIPGEWGADGAPSFTANTDLISVFAYDGDKSLWMWSFKG